MTTVLPRPAPGEFRRVCPAPPAPTYPFKHGTRVYPGLSPFFIAFWQFIYNLSLHSKCDNLKNTGKQPWPAQCIYLCLSEHSGEMEPTWAPAGGSSAQHQQHICSGDTTSHTAVYHHIHTAALQHHTAWLQSWVWRVQWCCHLIYLFTLTHNNLPIFCSSHYIQEQRREQRSKLLTQFFWLDLLSTFHDWFMDMGVRTRR